MKSFTVKINGKAYDCQVEETADKKLTRAEKGRIYAPVSGKVLGVFRSRGEKVRKGDVIMTVETPRTETEILAPRDGRIVITAAEGESVKPDDFLALISD